MKNSQWKTIDKHNVVIPLYEGQQPILVTGSHRSGSTWVGNMLALSSEVQYVPELFKPNGLLRHHQLLPYWFQYFEKDEGELFARKITRVFGGKFSIFEAFSLLNPDGKFDLRNSPARLRFYRDCKRNRIWNRHLRPLLKDPIALFSAEWLADNFNSQNIVLIRHPAAFVSSLLRLNWRFDFRNFENQSGLIEKYLAPFDKRIQEMSGDFLEEACLLWSCLHFVIHQYQKKHSNWVFLRHEDISRNPELEFKKIFQKININFTETIQQEIVKFSGPKNPKEVEKSGQIHQLKRDSRSNIKNWKERLTSEQTERVWELTKDVSKYFYNEQDW